MRRRSTRCSTRLATIGRNSFILGSVTAGGILHVRVAGKSMGTSKQIDIINMESHLSQVVIDRVVRK